jgi:hypothetical protein
MLKNLFFFTQLTPERSESSGYLSGACQVVTFVTAIGFYLCDVARHGEWRSLMRHSHLVPHG